MAAEIAGAMPSKQVTLVNSGENLLAGQPPKLMTRALKSLEKQGVKVRPFCITSMWGQLAAYMIGQSGCWRRRGTSVYAQGQDHASVQLVWHSHASEAAMKHSNAARMSMQHLTSCYLLP